MAIAEVIKYEGDNTTFVWKHPCEDFNSLTQLIVHESQEAVFMLNGQVLDIFGAGRYTLETQNIPLLGRLLHRVTGDKKPFHCEVYFVNLTEQMAIKWGTDSRIQFIDPTYGFPLTIGASGEMALRVVQSKKLLLKLVGTENNLGQAELTRFFRAFLMTRVKSYIARIIKTQGISIFEMDEHLGEISAALRDMLSDDFLDYGVSLERFFIMSIAKPDGEAQYEKFKSLHFRRYADVEEARIRQTVSVIDAETAAKKTVIESQALAQKRAQEGYTYQQERGFDVAEQVARNEAVGQLTNLGVGLGTMVGVGGTVAGVVGGTVAGAVGSTVKDAAGSAAATLTCAQCGAALPERAKFCLECGAKVDAVSAPATDTVVCPGCGATVPKKKFCPECGHRFTAVCPRCGADTAGAKFCPECGEKL